MEPKYPEIEVKLVGEDGNAFSIIGRMQRALKRGDVSEADIDQFLKEAISGDYHKMLLTCMEWVTVS